MNVKQVLSTEFTSQIQNTNTIIYEPHLTHFFASRRDKAITMSEGNEHTSNNNANILIKLGVHPNIISKNIKKHGSKCLSRVIT